MVAQNSLKSIRDILYIIYYLTSNKRGDNDDDEVWKWERW